MNSKEKKSEDFCPNYVQEFGKKGHKLLSCIEAKNREMRRETPYTLYSILFVLPFLPEA